MTDHCTKEAELAKLDQQIVSLEKDTTRHGVTVGKIYGELKDLNDKIGKLQTSTEVLWYKTGIWGMAGGAIPAVVTIIILIITGKI